MRNTGAEPLVILRSTGLSLERLVSDLDHKRYYEIDHRFPIATTVDSHSDAFARLRKGVYFVQSGYHKGAYSVDQFGTLRVAGQPQNAALPRADTVTIDKRYGVHAPASMPNRKWFELVDRAVVAVNLVVVPIDKATSDAAIDAFVRHPGFGKLNTISKHPVYAFGQASGAASTIYNPASLKPGRQMLITFPGSSEKLEPGQAQLVTIR